MGVLQGAASVPDALLVLSRLAHWSTISLVETGLSPRELLLTLSLVAGLFAVEPLQPTDDIPRRRGDRSGVGALARLLRARHRDPRSRCVFAVTVHLLPVLIVTRAGTPLAVRRVAELPPRSCLARCWALGTLYNAYARQDATIKVNWMFAMHGRRLDFAVLGSSRSYLTIDVPVVERAIQGHGLNLSMNGAEFAELALVLDRFLQRNTTRHLLLEVDPFRLDSKSFAYPFHAYFYLPYIDEAVVAEHLR